MIDDKTTAIEPAVGLAPLISLLPPRGFGYARRVAELLNINGIKPVRASSYTKNVVHQIAHKGHFDINVEPALIQIIEGFYGKGINELLPNYRRTHPERPFYKGIEHIQRQNSGKG